MEPDRELDGEDDALTVLSTGSCLSTTKRLLKSGVKTATRNVRVKFNLQPQLQKWRPDEHTVTNKTKKKTNNTTSCCTPTNQECIKTDVELVLPLLPVAVALADTRLINHTDHCSATDFSAASNKSALTVREGCISAYIWKERPTKTTDHSMRRNDAMKNTARSNHADKNVTSPIPVGGGDVAIVAVLEVRYCFKYKLKEEVVLQNDGDSRCDNQKTRQKERRNRRKEKTCNTDYENMYGYSVGDVVYGGPLDRNDVNNSVVQARVRDWRSRKMTRKNSRRSSASRRVRSASHVGGERNEEWREEESRTVNRQEN